jgi:hypothetical protein
VLDHGPGVAGGRLVRDYRFRFRLPGFGDVFRGAFGWAGFGFGEGLRRAGEAGEDFGERTAEGVEGRLDVLFRDRFAFATLAWSVPWTLTPILTLLHCDSSFFRWAGVVPASEGSRISRATSPTAAWLGR